MSKYEKEYWIRADPDGKIRTREEERHLVIEDNKDVLSYIHKLKPGKILDYGCGMGFLLSAVDNKWEKYGIDKSEYAKKIARKYASIVDNVEDGSMDVIINTHVIEHVDNPEELIYYFWYKLKEGGKLIITTPNGDSGCARRFGNNYRMLHDPTHKDLLSDTRLREILEHVKFHVDNVEYPFFETRHFTKENLMRLFDTTKVSPPFYGNIMTFYCTKL